MRAGYVYIMANRKNGTLYIGSTADLHARVAEHKSGTAPGSFTAKYGCDKLVYYEFYDAIGDAVAREKAMKRYKRSWKIELIERDNADWRDLRLDWDD